MSKFKHLNKIALLRSPTQYPSYLSFRHLGVGWPKQSYFTWALLESKEGTQSSPNDNLTDPSYNDMNHFWGYLNLSIDYKRRLGRLD